MRNETRLIPTRRGTVSRSRREIYRSIASPPAYGCTRCF
jgi:hypothetical protein